MNLGRPGRRLPIVIFVGLAGLLTAACLASLTGSGVVRASAVSTSSFEVTCGQAGVAFACIKSVTLSAYKKAAPRSARRKARNRAAKRWPTAKVVVTDSYRSNRDRRWVLVNGEAKPRSPWRPWSAWLRKRGGSWRVILFADHAGAAGPKRVPCDIANAYSEASC